MGTRYISNIARAHKCVVQSVTMKNCRMMAGKSGRTSTGRLRRVLPVNNTTQRPLAAEGLPATVAPRGDGMSNHPGKQLARQSD